MNRRRQQKPSTRRTIRWLDRTSPKQARLFIAIEDNGKTDSVAMAIKTNDPRLLTRALYKIGQKDETFAKFLKLAAAKLGFMEKLEHDNEMTASSKELMKHLIEII